MKLNLPILILLLFFAVTLEAQTTQDTIDNPYFIQMMQNRSVNFYQTQRAANLYFDNRTREKGDGWKPYKRWEWAAEQEIDEFGNFPNVVLQDAVRDLMIQQSIGVDIVMPGIGPGAAPCKNTGNWKEMGPTNLPTNNTGQLNGMGRINAIGLHPVDTNIFFAGAAAGGIWKTTDGGNTWNVYSDSLATLGVSAIAIDPDDPDTMYFGSGDRDAGDALGYGVYKSTDGGETWALSNTGMGNREVGRLIIDPSNTAVLLAACNNGIYRSTNYGANWTRTFTGGFMKDIIFKPNNSQIVYATRNGIFYRSTNNGVTWAIVTSGLPGAGRDRGVIDVNPLDPSLVYFWLANGRVNQGFYLSRDSGVTFTTQSTTPNIHDYSTGGTGTGGQAWYNKDMVTDPTDAGIIYAAGVNIFKSTDTGRTWAIVAYWPTQVHADNHEMARCPITDRIFAANDGGLFYTRNQGAPWTDISSGLAVAQIYKMGASRTVKDVLITGFQDNGTGNYNNGWFTTRGGDGMDCEVDQTDSRYSYGELYYGNIFRVFNVNSQGTIANNGTNGITEQGGWVTPFTLREGSGTTMYIGYKNIWRSTNIRNSPPTWTRISNLIGGTNGSNWTEIESSIADSDILYASRSNGTFYRSDNINAATPTYNAITLPVAGTVRAIETDPSWTDAVYIGTGSRVYRSTNKGTSWTQINTNLPSNVRSILLDTSSPVRGIYVGTQRSGCWYTDTTMTTWKYFSTGMPAHVHVSDLEMYYEDQPQCKLNKLYASTYNRGVWTSSIYSDGTQKPVAMVEAYDTLFCSDGSITLKDESCNNPTQFLWEFSPNTVTYLGGTDSCSENITVKLPKGTYTFTHYAKNCNGYDSTMGTIIVGDTVKTACVTTTTNNLTSLGIFNVTFEQINRSSGGTGTDGEYVDVACTEVARVKRGQTYNIDVTTGTNNDEQVKVFIDFNNDGDFVDVGELVWSPARARTNHSGTIAIPVTATAGEIVRFRVRSDFNSIGTNPCSNLRYGQTEDYGLFIEPDTVEPRFVVDDSTICSGQTVVFTDSTKKGTGYPYVWNFGVGATPATAMTVGPHTVTYASPGYKTVTLTVDGNLLTKDSAVFVETSPDMSLSLVGNDSSMCVGESVTLMSTDANGTAATYQWQFNGVDEVDSTFINYRLSSVALADSGNYRLIAAMGGCLDTTDIQVLSIHDQPTATFASNLDSACFQGHQFNLTNSSTIGNGTALIYAWTFGDGNTSTQQDPSVSYAANGTYRIKLEASTAFGCLDSFSKDVKVISSPIMSLSLVGNDSSLCIGESVEIRAADANGGGSTYQWQFNGADVVDSTFLSYRLASVNLADSGNYRIIGSNGACLDTTEIQVLSIHAQPSASFTTDIDSSCFNNHQFVLTNTSTIGNGSLNNLWSFGDGNTSAASDTTISYATHGTYEIKLETSTLDGCIDSFKKTVKVNPTPTASFLIGDTSQCLTGNNFSFLSGSTIPTGTITHLWKFGDGNTSSTVSPSHTYATANDSFAMWLVVESIYGCMDSAYQHIKVNAEPVAAFTVDDTGQCFTQNNFVLTNTSSISNSSILSYNWTFGDGNSSTAQNTSHSYGVQNNYTIKLRVSSPLGCLDSTTQEVVLLESAVADFTLSDDSLCFNQGLNSFTLTNNSSIGTGTFTSAWDFGDATSNATKNPPAKSYATYDTAYLIQLINTTNEGCKDTLERLATLMEHPVANFAINDTTQCLNGNQFDFANGTTIPRGGFSNLWQFGDATTASSLNASHTYTGSALGNTVVLIATSDFGCASVASRNIDIYDQPANVSFTVNDSVQCNNGHDFVFTSGASIPVGTIAHAWNFGDANTSAAINPNHMYVTDGNYTVKLIVTSDRNCIDSFSKPLELHPNTVTGFSVNTNPQCFNGHSFDFTNTSTLSSGTFNNAWSLGDGTNAISASITSKTYGTFMDSFEVKLVTVTDQGCMDSAVNQAYLNQNPLVSFSINDTNQCFTGNAFAFASTSQFVNMGTNYTWTFGDGNGSALENPTHSYAVPIAVGIVKLVVETGQGCLDSTEMNISVSPNPVANYSINDSTQCLTGNQFAFTEAGSISAGTYTSDFDFGDGNNAAGSPTNHVYAMAGVVNTTLTLTSDSGCTHDLMIPIEVYPNPQVQFSVNDSAQCLVGNDFRVADNTIGLAAGFVRRWHVNGQRLPATGANTQNTFANTGNHTFKLHITSDKGCEDSLERLISVDDHPDFNVTGPTKLCLNSSVDLTAASLDPNLTYDWTENGNGPTTINPYTIVGNTTGNRNISVTATNAAGCTSDSVFNSRVRVYPLPVPIIDTAIVLLSDGIEISFIDNTNIPVNSRNWTFDPPGGGTNIREQFTIQDTTTYSASLTLTDTNGCVGTTNEQFFFSIPNGFYLPTAFSPNGDSRNEIFIIPGYVNVKTYSMKVFNRWGEIMFQSTDPKVGWDGKVGGNYVPDGAYGYFVEIIDYDGKKVIRKGTVLLMR